MVHPALYLTDVQTGRSVIPPWPGPPAIGAEPPHPDPLVTPHSYLDPYIADEPYPYTEFVDWGSRITALVIPAPDPPVLHSWGLGPSCGGLAALQPRHLGGGLYDWVIGTDPDIAPCHSAAIAECWLTIPDLYLDPPPDFGRHESVHTSRADIAYHVPLPARLACVYSAPPRLTSAITFNPYTNSSGP
jgi:hypothetical protein